MGQPQIKKEKFTIEEWIELEQSGDTRYEYHFGEVFAMAGGTLNHGTMTDNAFYELENNFRSKDSQCRAMSSEFKIEVNKEGRYVYPDTLAVCGKVEESKEVIGAITNPIIVIEVLSDSSEAYDHGTKYRYYKRLPSVKEYLILDQNKYTATLYRRNGNGDIFSRIEYEGADAVVDLQSIQLEITLEKFYRNVTFTTED